MKEIKENLNCQNQSALWVDLPRNSRLEDYVGLGDTSGSKLGYKAWETKRKNKRKQRNAASINDLPLSDLHK